MPSRGNKERGRGNPGRGVAAAAASSLHYPQMITGFNTDVEHAGKKFHVQTQEQGRSNPVVETLVYAGGEIVTFVTNSYADIVEASGQTREAVFERMEVQHEMLIRQILTGKFDQAPRSYGHNVVTRRSLDEVVLDYLDDSVQLLAEVQDQLAENESDSSASTGPPIHVKVDRLRRVLTRLERRIDEEVRPADRNAAVSSHERVAPIPAPAVSRPVRSTRKSGASGRIWALSAVAGAILAVVVFGVNGERFEASRFAPGAGEYGRTVEKRTPAGSGEALPVESAPAEPADTEGAQGDDPSVATSPEKPLPDSKHVTPAEVAPSTPARVDAVPRRRPPSPAPKPAAVPSTAEGFIDAAQEESPVETRGEQLDRAHDGPFVDAQPEPTVAEPQRTVAVSPTRRGQLVEYSEVDVEPVPVRRDLPRYTRQARRQDRQGVVEMRILVIENGRVAHAEMVEEIPGSDLGDAAIEATRTWQFTPARKDGVPVRVWKAVRVRFAISSSGKAIVRVEE